jgi:microcompartment protein CcmL/EutN
MPQAVGVIQTIGFPPVLAAADAMVKAAAVTLVYYGLAERAEFLVAVRGQVSEVERAVEAGVKAAAETPGGIKPSYYVIPNPTENVESVLPIHFTAEVEDFRFFI